MRTIAVILLHLLPAAAIAQEPATAYTSTEVAPGIYVLVGADGFGGGNIGLLAGEDHIAIIDDGLVPTADILLNFVNKLAGRPVDFVINTHVHGDHTGGNAHFATNDAVIVAHDNVRQRLKADAEPAGGPGGIPTITFADGVTLHLNGIEARVHHLPAAHTDGDSFVVFPAANLIQTGDVFFNGMYPYIDLDNGGSVDGYIEAQRRIIELSDSKTRLIPGHGEVGTKADLEAALAMLLDARASVKALVDAGKSEDEVVAANPLAAYHDDYDWPFITTERMTRTLYRDLAGA
jgi:glyoxylase-like metal-dependent hydrolase (beta-lactamase superfamily II)